MSMVKQAVGLRGVVEAGSQSMANRESTRLRSSRAGLVSAPSCSDIRPFSCLGADVALQRDQGAGPCSFGRGEGEGWAFECEHLVMGVAQSHRFAADPL